MATVMLVRHGRTAANAAGILVGRAAGVPLDDVGRAQAERTAQRLGAIRLAAIVSSPLERCRETASIVLPPLALLLLALWLGVATPACLTDAWQAAVQQLFPAPAP